MAGLLHDLGKVILDTYFNEQYTEVVEEMVEEVCGQCRAFDWFDVLFATGDRQ